MTAAEMSHIHSGEGGLIEIVGALPWILAASVLTLSCWAGDSRTPSEPADDGDVAALSLEWSIGSLDGLDQYDFGQIRSLLPTADGTIWVLDGGTPAPYTEPMLRQYDSAGNFLKIVGRRGEGPGEFEFPFALGELPDGRVILRDTNQPNRLTVYQPDGPAAATWTFDAPYPGMGGYITLVDTSGVVWVEFREQPSAERAILRILGDGTILDTLRVPAFTQPKGYSIPVSAREDQGQRPRRSSVRIPYGPGMVWALSPQGWLATASTDRYCIEFHETPGLRRREHEGRANWYLGGVAYTVCHEPPPVIVSEAERRDQRNYLLARFDHLGVSPSGPVSEIPQTKPYIRYLRFGEDGRLWVAASMRSERYDPPPASASRGRTSAPVIGWREPTAFDVFETDGSYLGKVVLPEESCWGRDPQTMRMRGDLIWCVARGRHGINLVHRYRVTWR